MKRRSFICHFKSDIILNSKTATVGSSQSLDYIPGSTFLGITARKYDEFGDNCYEVFHSGKVRFGDAHIAIDEKRTFKLPYDWFHEKADLKLNQVYLKHVLNQEQLVSLQEKGTQLKQMREGFISHDDSLVKPDHLFALKSAHNKNERRLQEGQLYGYDALRGGSSWIFSVDAEREDLLEQVAQKLQGEHHIGRSRSNQYGEVTIEAMEKPVKQDEMCLLHPYLLFYLESNAAFLDTYGEPTYSPSLKDLKLPIKGDFKILWDKSQIRTRTYAPWNSKRKTRDADRVVIEKGSVIVVEIPAGFYATDDFQKLQQSLQSGVGVYRNEGLGQVILNPRFCCEHKDGLIQKQLTRFESIPVSQEGAVENDSSDSEVMDWVEAQVALKSRNEDLLHKVNCFIDEDDAGTYFSNVSASQWGTIHSIAVSISDDENLLDRLFTQDTGFLKSGKLEPVWRKGEKKLEEKLKDVKNRYPDGSSAKNFLISLCLEMAKHHTKKQRREFP